MHHANPKTARQWNKVFANSKTTYFQGYFRFFHQNKIFYWLYHFFCLSLSNQKLIYKFFKTSMDYFLEKVVLTNWLIVMIS